MPVGNDGIGLLAVGTRQRIAATWGDRPAQAGAPGKGLDPWPLMGVQPNFGAWNLRNRWSPSRSESLNHQALKSQRQSGERHRALPARRTPGAQPRGPQRAGSRCPFGCAARVGCS